jgi:hypothetical protein
LNLLVKKSRIENTTNINKMNFLFTSILQHP